MKKGADGEQHYVVLGVVLSVNNNSENFATYGETIKSSDTEPYLKSIVTEVVSQFTYEQIQDDQEAVRSAILQKYQDIYGKDLVVDVGFSSFTPQ